MSLRTFAGSRTDRAIVAETGLGIRITPPPPPGTIVVPPSVLTDATGTDDLTAQIAAWVGGSTGGVPNIPNGTPGNPTVVLFPPKQPDGVTRAVYRIEGGMNAGIRINQKTDVVFSGGGTPGQKGLDGAQFIEKSGVNASGGHLFDDFFVVTADPATNPRGLIRGHGGTTFAANSNLTFASQDFTTTAVVGDHIELRKDTNPANYVTRTITALNVGGDIHTITYSGASIGASTSVGIVINPDRQWNLLYTPTNQFHATTYTGAGAVDAATNAQFNLQRSRTMFIVQQCHRVTWRGIQFTGANPTVWNGTAGYQSDIESQDGIDMRGGTDMEIDDCTIEKFWGNGMEAQPFVLANGSYEAPIGLWVHGSTLQNFGRQALSLTYGGHFIFEDAYIGESARSLIDSEPTTNRIDPGLRNTVDGIYLLSCTIGKHGLGMLALHDGIEYLRVEDCVEAGSANSGIGTSGIAIVDHLIAQSNVDNGASAANRWRFIEGEFNGGQSILIQNNDQQVVTTVGVTFSVISRWGATTGYINGDLVTYLGEKYASRTGSKASPNTGHAPISSTGVRDGVDWADRGPSIPCSNYLVRNNNFGAGIPQYSDTNPTPFNPANFVPFPLPIPAHALRDLALTGVAVDEDNIPYADTNNVNYTW